MKVQRFLFAGALTSMAMLAGPVLSQNNPRPQPTNPRPQPTDPSRTDTPGISGRGGMQVQALNPLVGRWDVTVKMFNSDSGAGSSSSTPTSQAQGTSTRSWMVDGKILQEEVRCSGISALSQRSDAGHDAIPVANELTPQNTPPSRTTPGQSGDSMSESFVGHGMFGYDSKTNEFQHVWCDSTDSKLTMSTGKYDERTKTFTFMVHETPGMGSRDTTMPPSSRTPGSKNPANPGSDNPGMNPDRDNPDRENPEMNQVSPRPGTTNPPSTTTPPSGQPGNPHVTSPGSPSVSMAGLNRVVIRVQSDDKQVVEYYKSGQSSKFMEVTYTKSH